jgi:methyl-accepting chemotaxis protein
MSFIFRRIYFIKKDFQTRFILRFVISATAWAVLTVFLFVVMADKRLEEIRYSTHIMVKTTSDILLPSALTVQAITLLVFAIMLIYAIQSLWTNLASPLYSLKKDIWRIADGDLASPVSLREEDEFHDLAMDFDKMRSDLRHRWARIKERQDVLANVTADLSKSIAKGTPSVADAARLRETVERMKEEINAFKY